MIDQECDKCLTELKLLALTSSKAVVQKFLDNKMADNYKELVADMLQHFRRLVCNMRVKLYFLRSHLDDFSINLGNFNEEHIERFHQTITFMEIRYQESSLAGRFFLVG